MGFFQGNRILITALVMTGFSCGVTYGQVKPEEVTFQSGSFQLHGFLWKPGGEGPFPAVLWNHGSEKYPGAQPTLAGFYTSHNYVFFIPHRRGQGRSPGNYIQDLVGQTPPAFRGRRLVELQEEQVSDVLAALAFLKSKGYVDTNRIAISGCSYGGIETLLVGEHDLGIRALVPFAPGAMSWDKNPEIAVRLRRAVQVVSVPVFLLQAKNDYSLSPSHALTSEASSKHKDFRSRIYPAFGDSAHDGHWGFCTSGSNVWGADVLRFLDDSLKAKLP